MAWNLVEDIDSPEFTVDPANPRTVRRFTVSGGTQEDVQASAFFESEIAPFYFGLILQNYTQQHQGNGVYRFVADYGSRQKLSPAASSPPTGPGAGSGPGGGTGGPAEVKSAQFSFDTTGGSANIKSAIQTMNAFTPPGIDIPIDFEEQINVDDEGKAQGLDVTIPQMAFTVQRLLRHPLASTFFDELFEKVGTINSDTVVIPQAGKVCVPGSLLYMGASGSQRGREEWDVSLKFSYSAPIVNKPIGPILVTSARGWDYIWVKYKTIQATEGTVRPLIQIPIQATVVQVFKSSTHGNLLG